MTDEIQTCDSIAVLVAVGVPLYREGLAGLLERERGIVVKGTAENQADAVAEALALSPDIILLDTGLPDGLHTVRALLNASSVSKVIALAVTETETEVVSYAEAGVSG